MAYDPNAWKEAYERLNPYQREVVKGMEALGQGTRLPPGEVVAAAGSGKTATVVAGIAKIVHEGKIPLNAIMLTTFTKKGAAEMLARLEKLVAPHHLTALRIGTWHALAGRHLRTQATKPPHGWRQDRCIVTASGGPGGLRSPEALMRDIVGEDWKEVRELPGTRGMDLSSHGDGYSARDYLLAIDVLSGMGLNPTHDTVESLAAAADKRFPRLQEGPPIVEVERRRPKTGYLVAAWTRYQAAKKAIGGWDFNDSMDAYWRFGTDAAKLVIVDEAQDNSFNQLDAARKVAHRGWGAFLLVGDVRQCIPEGQYVGTPTGPRKIEEIRAGDRVHASVAGVLEPKTVLKVSTTHKAEAYRFQTASGHAFKATAEHVLWAALGNCPDPDGQYVYLMWRPHYGFRIGVTGFGAEYLASGISLRSQQEQAERMWLLAYGRTGAEARRMEHTLSYRFGVPQAPFKLRGKDPMFASDQDAAAFFREFEANGYKLLNAFQQDFNRPAYTAKSTARVGRVAVNILRSSKNGTEVCLESRDIPANVAKELGCRPTKSGCQRVRRNFTDASQAGAYVQKVMDSLLSVGVGAYTVERLAMRRESDWSSYVRAVPAAGVQVGMLLPVVIDGVIHLSPVVSREQVPADRCFDLEVASAVNFTVSDTPGDGVVVHNSIFSWKGAEPSFMLDLPRTDGAQVMEIPSNYRSGKHIVALGNKIAEGKSWSMGSPAEAFRTNAPGSERPINVGTHTMMVGHAYGPPGSPIVPGYLRVLPQEEDMVAAAGKVALEIKALLHQGVSAKEIAILSRTNASGVPYEIALLTEQIPAMVVGSKWGFFDRGPVVDCMAWAALLSGVGTGADLLRAAQRPDLKLTKANKDTMEAENLLTAPAASVVSRMLRNTPGVGRARERNREGWESLKETLGDLPEGGLGSWGAVVDAVLEIVLPKEEDGADEGDSDTGSDLITAWGTIARGFADLASLRTFAARMSKDVARYGNPSDMSPEERARFEEDSKKRIVISTVHKSKGLEWAYVYLDLTGGVFPHFRSVGPNGGPSDEEERLFYVAVTRAADVLTVTHCAKTPNGKPAGDPGFLSIVTRYIAANPDAKPPLSPDEQARLAALQVAGEDGEDADGEEVEPIDGSDADEPTEVLYHLVLRDPKKDKDTYMTSTPVSRREAEVIMSKQSPLRMSHLFWAIVPVDDSDEGYTIARYAQLGEGPITEPSIRLHGATTASAPEMLLATALAQTAPEVASAAAEAVGAEPQPEAAPPADTHGAPGAIFDALLRTLRALTEVPPKGYASWGEVADTLEVLPRSSVLSVLAEALAPPRRSNVRATVQVTIPKPAGRDPLAALVTSRLDQGAGPSNRTLTLPWAKPVPLLVGSLIMIMEWADDKQRQYVIHRVLEDGTTKPLSTCTFAPTAKDAMWPTCWAGVPNTWAGDLVDQLLPTGHTRRAVLREAWEASGGVGLSVSPRGVSRLGDNLLLSGVLAQDVLTFVSLGWMRESAPGTYVWAGPLVDTATREG